MAQQPTVKVRIEGDVEAIEQALGRLEKLARDVEYRVTKALIRIERADRTLDREASDGDPD